MGLLVYLNELVNKNTLILIFVCDMVNFDRLDLYKQKLKLFWALF